jgi:hypothetical protein
MTAKLPQLPEHPSGPAACWTEREGEVIQAAIIAYAEEAVRVAVGELQKDANRYRWLRDCTADDEEVVMVRGERGRHTDELQSGAALDAAIDAALNSEAAQG